MKAVGRRNSVLNKVRSLGVGGSLGSAAGAVAYGFVPAVRRSGVSLSAVVSVGAALGAAAHQGMQPLFPTLKYIGRIILLRLEARMGWMSRDDASRLLHKHQHDYYCECTRHSPCMECREKLAAQRRTPVTRALPPVNSDSGQSNVQHGEQKPAA